MWTVCDTEAECLHRDHIYTLDIETADTEEIFFSKVSLRIEFCPPLNHLAANEALSKSLIPSGAAVTWRVCV